MNKRTSKNVFHHVVLHTLTQLLPKTCNTITTSRVANVTQGMHATPDVYPATAKKNKKKEEGDVIISVVCHVRWFKLITMHMCTLFFNPLGYCYPLAPLLSLTPPLSARPPLTQVTPLAWQCVFWDNPMVGCIKDQKCEKGTEPCKDRWGKKGGI